MTVIKRITEQLSKQAERKVVGLLNEKLPPSLGGVANQVLRSAVTGSSMPKKDITNLLQGAVLDRLPGPARAAASRVVRNLAEQRKGNDALALARNSSGVMVGDAPQFAGPGNPALHGGGTTPLFGGLSAERALQMFKEATNTARAWKNLWHIKIEEKVPPLEAPQGLGGLINMLAIDLNFGPCTIAGDQVQIGSGVVDRVTGTERVDLELTTYDDAAGSVQRWFIGKCNQIAQQGGTFGLPINYLVRVTITEMDVEGGASPSNRMVHRLWMRPVSYTNDLSRRTPELKEIQLRFTQWDSFL